MRGSTSTRALLLAVCSLGIVGSSSAQALRGKVKDDNSAMHQKMAEFAAELKVHQGLTHAAGEAKPTLVAKPIFRWTNPERKTDVGNIFLWTINGRPHATLGIWPEGETYGYEMQSLAPEPFSVEFPNNAEWKQRAGALEFRKLENQKPPGNLVARRTFAMRHILRTRFSARIQDWDKKNPAQLRLLPNPLYRYPKTKPMHVIDGAVFAFALGTDPEMLVLLEARKHPATEELSWYYAFGSAALNHLNAYLDGKHVWDDRGKFQDRTYLMRY